MKTSFPKEKIKILLLEGIHQSAAEEFNSADYRAEIRKSALNEDQLSELIPSVHILGIRSRTQITPRVLKQARRLLAIGCFCIGTNQVALKEARTAGTVVFNAPFSNTRSVAELTMAEIVMLARKAVQRSIELHQGRWEKTAAGSYEVRNKTVGIIGYGHIGPQVGLLAEAFGMKVIFYDIVPKLPLGNARPAGSLQEVLREADFVTLHVPETDQTRGMISSEELKVMKEGSYLLNLSRGSVVDLDALAEAIKSGHLAGAALDVYPEEPAARVDSFNSVVCGLPNVILTPHVGGSTVEAQQAIGREVASSLIKFLDTGSTSGAVNFPQVELPLLDRDCHRILNIHRNVPGVMRDINNIIADTGVNIEAQYLSTMDNIGYLIMDVGKDISREVKKRIDSLEASIRTRLLF
ncbi:MAG: phosphoglycerate dehydrogenase [Candidatus Dadabacteria bacterium]|nr:MAG: phosphoglycerate dehydrogenase [Candidatus Dadabacteria bacterium]